MTAMSPWKMAENRTSIYVPYVDRRAYVNVRSVSTCSPMDPLIQIGTTNFWYAILHVVWLSWTLYRKHTIIKLYVIIEHVQDLKSGKYDGGQGMSSMPITLSIPLISFTFSYQCSSRWWSDMVMLQMVYVIQLLPIPKNKHKSLSDSNNYRAVAWSRIIGKLLDIIILTKCQDVFLTSPL